MRRGKRRRASGARTAAKILTFPKYSPAWRSRRSQWMGGRALKGKTFVVRRPHDLAKALQQIGRAPSIR